MIRGFRQLLLGLTTVGALYGCGILGLGEEQRLGVLQIGSDTAVVYVPGSVARDSAFAVRFYTFGGGCVSADHTSVSQSERTATVTPFDKHSGADACTADVRFLQHEALVQFAAAGPATVVVRGASEPGGGFVELRFPLLVEER